MEVIIRNGSEETAEVTSRLIAAGLRSMPDHVLGLASGRTMERVNNRVAVG